MSRPDIGLEFLHRYITYGIQCQLSRRNYFCILVLLNLGFGLQVIGSNTFQISGYYLGETPEELGVTFESDTDLELRFFEGDFDDGESGFENWDPDY